VLTGLCAVALNEEDPLATRFANPSDAHSPRPPRLFRPPQSPLPPPPPSPPRESSFVVRLAPDEPPAAGGAAADAECALASTIHLANRNQTTLFGTNATAIARQLAAAFVFPEKKTGGQSIRLVSSPTGVSRVVKLR
jgi:hypothetical protein